MPTGLENKIGRGVARVWLADPGAAQSLLLATAENTWMYEWAHCGVMLCATGNPAYALSTLYVEFENLTSPSATSTPPTVTRDQGLSYYLGLASSGTRDFLRIALAYPPTPSRDASYAGTAYLRPNLYNRLTLAAFALAGTGVNLKSFSAAANSKIVGVAAVATPVPTDPTSDIVFARAYFTGTQQVLAPTTGSLVVTYSPTFQ